jgi:hypothetical protein
MGDADLPKVILHNSFVQVGAQVGPLPKMACSYWAGPGGDGAERGRGA